MPDTSRTEPTCSTRRIAIVSAALGCVASGVLLAAWDVAILRTEAAALRDSTRELETTADLERHGAGDIGRAAGSDPFRLEQDTARLTELRQQMWRLGVEEQTLKAQAASLEEAREEKLKAAAGSLWQDGRENSQNPDAAPWTFSIAHEAHLATATEEMVRHDAGAEADLRELHDHLQHVRSRIHDLEAEYQAVVENAEHRRRLAGPQTHSDIGDTPELPRSRPMPVRLTNSSIGTLARAHALSLLTRPAQSSMRNWRLAYAWYQDSPAPWDQETSAMVRAYMAAPGESASDWPIPEASQR